MAKSYKRVDVDEPKLSGFTYMNSDGDAEYVEMDGSQTRLFDDNGNHFIVYKRDVPKLIKALQAAYEYKE